MKHRRCVIEGAAQVRGISGELPGGRFDARAEQDGFLKSIGKTVDEFGEVFGVGRLGHRRTPDCAEWLCGKITAAVSQITVGCRLGASACLKHDGVPLFCLFIIPLARPSCQAFSSRQKLCVFRGVRLNRFGQDLRLGPSERRGKIRQQAVHTGWEVRGQHFGRVEMSRSAASPFRAVGPVALHPPTSVTE